MLAIKGLSFFADGAWYAADAALVQKIVRRMKIAPVPAAPGEVIGISSLHGMVVTVLRVPALPGGERSAAAPRVPFTACVVVFKASACGGEQMGFAVERPGDLLDIDEEMTVPQGDEPSVPGVFESEGVLYRMINLDSTISRYRDGGDRAAPLPEGGKADEDRV